LYRGETVRNIFNTQVRDSVNYGTRHVIQADIESFYMLNRDVDPKMSIGKTWIKNNNAVDISFGVNYFFE
jgi:hypothetical protein